MPIDLAFEWYFAKESLLSLALFYKDVGSRPTATTSSGPFTGNPFGIPDSVAIAACGATSGCSPSAEWTFNTTVNGDGGWLRGLEASYQQPFTFLTGVFSGFGTIMNFTYVDSEFKYPNGAAVIVEQLDGLSKISWNATLYYEKSRFSARVSAAFRDQYPDAHSRAERKFGGGHARHADAGCVGALQRDRRNSTSRFEALNLTDAFQDQYVDASNRPVLLPPHRTQLPPRGTLQVLRRRS